jgi:serine protease inhibitor
MGSLWKRLLGRESDPNALKAGTLSVRQESSMPESVRREATTELAAERDVPSAVQAFGLELLKQECASRPRENVFISPLSVYLALAMAENGAGGETKQAMRRSLRIAGDAEALKWNAEAKQLVQELQRKAGIELSIGNALWVDSQLSLAPEFVNLCAEYFDALVQTLEMKNPASAKIINDWVSEKTREKISAIVSAEALRETATLITNAVYFKGKFHIPFGAEATRPKPFHLANGQQKQVPMMHKVGMGAQYRSGNGCEAAVLRYAGGETKGFRRASDIELILILAKRDSPEKIFREDLSPLFQNPDREIVLNLALPRFKMDFESGLNQSLELMGMGIALRYPGADFVPMGSELFYIANVLHKTRVEVDEEGTVAAAATSMVTLCSSARVRREPETRTLVFDRPFAVLLRDSTSGAVLFAGVLYEP